MDRVSWDRYVGEDVEAVVAMMVNREHPNSTRITPSRGDGGIDILDALAGPDGGDVVYQVKRYAKPLKSGEKREIEKSLKRLLGEKPDPRWVGRNVTQWRLVLPWDPTPEAFAWLDGLGGRYGVQAVWDGLTTIDRWCASFPEIIDYYLKGGRDRVEAAYTQAMAFTSLSTPATEGLDVHALAERVQESLRGPLSQDPHYRYGFRFGEGEPDLPAGGGGLVMSSATIRKEGWFAIDVYARCAASHEARPITLDARFSAETGSPQADALRRFFEYGETPKELIQLDGELDAPGGLSAMLTGATAQMLPADVSTSDEYGELRLEILDAAGEVLATCRADRLSAGSGTKGGSFVYRDTAGVFDLIGQAEVRALHAEENGRVAGEAVVERAEMKLRLRPEGLEGASVMTVSDSIAFMAQFHGPNQFRLGSRHLPARHGVTESLEGIKASRSLVEVAAAIRALSTIQQHVSQAVRVPDLAEHRKQIPTWVWTAQLLEGKRMGIHYPEGHVVVVDTPEDVGDREHDRLRVLQPLEVQIGSETLHLGEMVLELDAPTLHSRTPMPDGGVRLAFTTDERAIFWTLYDPLEENSEPEVEPPPENGLAR